MKKLITGLLTYMATRKTFPSIFGPSEVRANERTVPPQTACEPASAPLTLIFNVEKIAGKGEDADPVLVQGDGYDVIAVFDGMGGAGASLCDGPAGRRTGAFYASTLASGFTRDIAQRDSSLLALGTAADIAAHLYRDLAVRLNDSAGLLTSSSSKLRSPLLRRLPTTAAISIVRGDSGEVFVFWAGDSRVYLLTPAGLRQLTRDHLRGDSDAMTNLERDAPLANCVHADGVFSISWRSFRPEAGYIVIACTDGCFGFVASPMHFEQVLLETMAEAATMDEWRAQLIASLGAITGDDMSMAALAIGWPAFDAMQAAFVSRRQVVSRDIVGELVRLDDEHAATVSRLADLDAACRTAKARAWDAYRTTYDASATASAAGEATHAEG